MAKLANRELVTLWLARDYQLAIKKGLTLDILKQELSAKGYKDDQLQTFLDYFKNDLQRVQNNKGQQPFAK